jgi:hypothetical protein
VISDVAKMIDTADEAGDVRRGRQSRPPRFSAVVFRELTALNQLSPVRL